MQPGFHSLSLQPGELLEGQGLPDGEWSLQFGNQVETLEVNGGLIQHRLDTVGIYTIILSGSNYATILLSICSLKERATFNILQHKQQVVPLCLRNLVMNNSVGILLDG